jgi:uncharacterized protein YhaN
MVSLQDQALVTLSIKGFADVHALASALAISPAEAVMIFETLQNDDLIKPVALGYKLRAAGKERALTAWQSERKDIAASTLEQIYEVFAQADAAMREYLSDWKMKKTEAGPARNIHDDGAYDAEILKEILELCDKISPALEQLARQVPRCRSYCERLAAASAKAGGGMARYVAGAEVDSLGSIWLELETDIGFLTAAQPV